MKFNDEMKLAITNGIKTVTRRPLVPQPVHAEGGYFWPEFPNWEVGWAAEDSAIGCRVPDYKPHANNESMEQFCKYGRTGARLVLTDWQGGPQLRITSIRVERLQDLTEADAIKEGFKPPAAPNFPILQGDFVAGAATSFAIMWNTIYEDKGLGWGENPWVWVIEFETVEKVTQCKLL